jgi:hypothetical protein
MFNKKDFIGRKEAIIKYFNKKPVSNNNISEYCSMAGIPITVVCEFIREEMPEHSKLCSDKIKKINKFYGIKEEVKTCGFCTKPCNNDFCPVKESDEES